MDHEKFPEQQKTSPIRILPVLCSVLACFSVVIAVASLSGHNYDEVRIHNKAVEARLSEWITRAQQHSMALLLSDAHALRDWREEVEKVVFSDEYTGLKDLNRVINARVVYRDDYAHFHLKDYWADPTTTLLEGGDCEDIALLKAASLLHVGWPKQQMHLLVGYLTERGKRESHAVLLVETRNGDQYILRSITGQVVKPDEFGFVPIYGVDGEGTFIARPHGST